MKPKRNNYAYIDGANLHNGVGTFDWEFDYKKFRVWLLDKHGVCQAYLFLGFISKYKKLYRQLKEDGFTLVFKDVTYDIDGKVKGNCDADIVVRAMRDSFEDKFKKALLVSSDGDYASLVAYLLEKKKLEMIISPAHSKKCSILLKRTGARISYLEDQKVVLQLKRKSPQ